MLDTLNQKFILYILVFNILEVKKLDTSILHEEYELVSAGQSMNWFQLTKLVTTLSSFVRLVTTIF